MKKIFLLSLISFICSGIQSQDFHFSWKYYQSLAGTSYTVKISQEGRKRKILIKESWHEQDSVKKRFHKKDVDTLLRKLKDYDFPRKNNFLYGPVIKTYHKTKTLADTSWMLVKGDSVRKEIMFWTHGYDWDPDSCAAFSRSQSINGWTDGSTFYGDFSQDSVKRIFQVYCTRLSERDIELFTYILDLMQHYYPKGKFDHIRQKLELYCP